MTATNWIMSLLHLRGLADPTLCGSSDSFRDMVLEGVQSSDFDVHSFKMARSDSLAAS